MKSKKCLTVILLILAVVLCFSFINAAADFGDFGGDSDYGGGSDWGDSDSDGSGGAPGAIGLLFGTGVIVFFVLIGLIYGKIKGVGIFEKPALRTIAEYRTRDPGFSEPALCAKISNLYYQMQYCWTAKNMESLRPYFTDVSYAQFDRQLDNYRQNYRTNYVERIAVLSVELKGWYEQESNDCMLATVRTRIVDYTIDDRNGALISGSRTAEKFMTYEYVMIRSSGYVTVAQSRDAATINCPNCGSPLNINYSAKCPYCNSIITTKDYDWVISSIKGISQQTK